MSLPAAVYRPRNPQLSDYYRCVEDYFEIFAQIYDEHFSELYGFWRPYLEKVIHRYLNCGDVHNGFARVKCKDCGHEYLLLLQPPPLLPLLPRVPFRVSETRGGIRGAAVHGCPQKGSPPAFCRSCPRVTFSH